MVVSLQAGAFIPGNVENGFNEPLGQGGLEWEFRALAGRSFAVAGHNAFADIQLAYRSRARRADDEIRASATVGYYPKPNLLLMGQAFTVHGLPSAHDNIQTIANLKVQFGGVWFFSSGQNGIQIAGARTLYGRNVIRDTGLTLSWWHKF